MTTKVFIPYLVQSLFGVNWFWIYWLVCLSTQAAKGWGIGKQKGVAKCDDQEIV
jgi:hypothetical protein